MNYRLARLHTTAARMYENAQQTLKDRDTERGSVTIENVLWAVAVIAIVAIVVAAITAYVRSKSGEIK